MCVISYTGNTLNGNSCIFHIKNHSRQNVNVFNELYLHICNLNFFFLDYANTCKVEC